MGKESSETPRWIIHSASKVINVGEEKILQLTIPEYILLTQLIGKGEEGLKQATVREIAHEIARYWGQNPASQLIKSLRQKIGDNTSTVIAYSQEKNRYYLDAQVETTEEVKRAREQLERGVRVSLFLLREIGSGAGGNAFSRIHDYLIQNGFYSPDRVLRRGSFYGLFYFPAEELATQFSLTIEKIFQAEPVSPPWQPAANRLAAEATSLMKSWKIKDIGELNYRASRILTIAEKEALPSYFVGEEKGKPFLIVHPNILKPIFQKPSK